MTVARALLGRVSLKVVQYLRGSLASAAFLELGGAYEDGAA